MNDYKLTEVEEKLITKFQQTKDPDIAMYFFNKIGQDVLNVVYSKITLKFSSIPFEREDLISFVWKSLQKGLEIYEKDKGNLWNIWVNNSYFVSVREIQKYFKNTELILNHAISLDKFEENQPIYEKARSIITFQKQPFQDMVAPIIDYVVKHNRTYGRKDIKKLLYLRSLGYSEREIAKKMNVSRRYITSMIKVVLRISKRYLRTSDR